MPKAIVMERTGGAEVLEWRDIAMPEPGPGEVLLKQTAVGLNFIDCYHRSGLYPVEKLPAIIGSEGAGIIIKRGPGCSMYPEGERVAYAGGPLGSYAQYRVIPERNIVRIPDAIPDKVAAGIMLKGLTAHYLVRHTFKVDNKTTMLVHAAAGGVGLLLVQWGKLLGARVIGTVGSDEKAQLALANGCDFVINYKKEDFVPRVREITGGVGCNVVYDSVGAATFMKSLDCLRPIGLMVSFGQSSGKVPPVDIYDLQKRGSLFLTRPTLRDYTRDHAEYVMASAEVMRHVVDQKLKINIRQSYFLSEAARAHADLEAGHTTGATIMVVDGHN